VSIDPTAARLDQQTEKAHAFSTDRPISSKAEDLLGRADFAGALAKAVEGWKQRDSLVLAVYGPWGSGKTSVKNLVLESLQREEPAHRVAVVEFNPWQWSAQHQVAEAFFEQIGAALGRDDEGTEGKRRAARWREYAAYLRIGVLLARGVRGVAAVLLGLLGVVGLAALAPPLWLRAIPAALGAVALALGAFLAWGGKMAEAWASAVTARLEARRRELSEVKQELAELLRELQLPLLVVVDDIDRLTPPEVRLLFQLVKANADFPNLVYLLLFQRDLIEQSLENRGRPLWS
jgi:predicted KAP-like P-loop ATPase